MGGYVEHPLYTCLVCVGVCARARVCVCNLVVALDEGEGLGPVRAVEAEDGPHLQRPSLQ